MKSGSELKAIRESLALSVADVARMTFMTRQHIYLIEKGGASPRNYLFLELFYEDFQRKRLMHRQ